MSNRKPRKQVEPAELVFNERNVHTLPLPEKGRIYYRCEKGPTGFRLVVTDSGYRGYFLIYRPRTGGPSRAYRIGPAEDLSFREAQSKAETIRGLVAHGRDPFAEEKAERQAQKSLHLVTLRECVDYFVAAHRQTLDLKTIQAYEQTRNALPRRLVDSTAEEITPALFREAVKEATRAPIMQNRHLGRLKAVLRFAHSEQRIARLPAIVGMKRPNTEVKRDRVLTADEIKALWRAVDSVAPSMVRAGVAFAASVRLMLLLGTRLGETALAKWDEIDLEGNKRRSDAVPEGQAMWYIPAEHRKGERGKKRPHWVPLPPLAASLFRELRLTTGDKPVIFWKAGYSGRTYMLRKLLAEMARLGQPEPWTYHDLRRTCSTWLGEMGCPNELNDLILGHAKRGVIAHYDHSKRIADRAEWLRKWADRVADIAEIKTGAVLLLYEVAGQPVLAKSQRADLKGHRYVGALPEREARALAEEMRRKAEAEFAE